MKLTGAQILIESLKKVERDELFTELEKHENHLSNLRMDINNKFGFKICRL